MKLPNDRGITRAWRRVESWFVPPTFVDDEIRTRRASVLHWILLAVLALSFFTLLVRLLGAQDSFFVIAVNALQCLVSFWLYLVLRRGFVNIAAVGFFIVGLVSVTLIVAGLGTIRTPSIAMYLILVVSSGFFFGRRGIVLTVFGCALAALFLVFAEQNGWILSYRTEASIAQWAILVFLFSAVGILVFLSVRNVQNALARADNELAERRRMESALRASEERYRRLVTNSRDVVYRMSLPDGMYEYISPAANEMFGYAPSDFYGAPLLVRNIIHPRWREYFEKEWRKLLAGDVSPTYEYQIVTKTGQVRWLHQRNTLIRNADGAPIALEAIATDVTASQRANAVLAARERLLRASFTQDAQSILEYVLDEAEGLTDSCIGFFHFLEADQKNLILQNWSTRTKREFCTAQGPGLHYPVATAGVWANCVRERRAVIYNSYATLPDRKGVPEGHAEVLRMISIPIFRGENIVAIIGVGNAPYDYDGTSVQIVHQLADLCWDIIERKRAEAALTHLSTHDVLTGLYNRAFFETELARMENSREYPISIIVADLDNLKMTNDVQGHAAGDELLKRTAQVLRAAFRGSDVLCRIGGDEFAMLLPGADDATAVQGIMRIRAQLVINNAQHPNLPLSLSIGAGTNVAGDLLNTFRRADAAMYLDKRTRKTGRNGNNHEMAAAQSK